MPIGFQRCLTISRRSTIASFSRHTSIRKSAFEPFAFDTSTVRSLAAGSYGMVSTILNGRKSSRGRVALMPLLIAWPNVSFTCMNTAVRGTVLVSRKMSPISARPLRVRSIAVGKLRNTNL